MGEFWQYVDEDAVPADDGVLFERQMGARTGLRRGETAPGAAGGQPTTPRSGLVGPAAPQPGAGNPYAPPSYGGAPTPSYAPPASSAAPDLGDYGLAQPADDGGGGFGPFDSGGFGGADALSYAMQGPPSVQPPAAPQTFNAGGDSYALADRYSAQYGMDDPLVLRSLIAAESGGDPNAVGDQGNSIGLLQANMAGGRGAGYSADQLRDPNTNLQLGMQEIAPAYQQGVRMGLRGAELARYVGRVAQRPQAGNEQLYADAYGQMAGGGTFNAPMAGGYGGPPAPSVSRETSGGGLLDVAQSQMGKPYVFGSGPDTSSFDCSDYTQWVFGQLGVTLPRTAQQQYDATRGQQVDPSQAQPGDLVFFTNTYDAGVPVTHVAIYQGNGKFIGAQGQDVNVGDLGSPYWSSRLYAVTRPPGSTQGAGVSRQSALDAERVVPAGPHVTGERSGKTATTTVMGNLLGPLADTIESQARYLAQSARGTAFEQSLADLADLVSRGKAEAQQGLHTDPWEQSKAGLTSGDPLQMGFGAVGLPFALADQTPLHPLVRGFQGLAGAASPIAETTTGGAVQALEGHPLAGGVAARARYDEFGEVGKAVTALLNPVNLIPLHIPAPVRGLGGLARAAESQRTVGQAARGLGDLAGDGVGRRIAADLEGMGQGAVTSDPVRSVGEEKFLKRVREGRGTVSGGAPTTWRMFVVREGDRYRAPTPEEIKTGKGMVKVGLSDDQYQLLSARGSTPVQKHLAGSELLGTPAPTVSRETPAPPEPTVTTDTTVTPPAGIRQAPQREREAAATAWALGELRGGRNPHPDVIQGTFHLYQRAAERVKENAAQQWTAENAPRTTLFDTDTAVTPTAERAALDWATAQFSAGQVPLASDLAARFSVGRRAADNIIAQARNTVAHDPTSLFSRGEMRPQFGGETLTPAASAGGGAEFPRIGAGDAAARAEYDAQQGMFGDEFAPPPPASRQVSLGEAPPEEPRPRPAAYGTAEYADERVERNRASLAAAEQKLFDWQRKHPTRTPPEKLTDEVTRYRNQLRGWQEQGGKLRAEQPSLESAPTAEGRESAEQQAERLRMQGELKAQGIDPEGNPPPDIDPRYLATSDTPAALLTYLVDDGSGGYRWSDRNDPPAAVHPTWVNREGWSQTFKPEGIPKRAAEAAPSVSRETPPPEQLPELQRQQDMLDSYERQIREADERVGQAQIAVAAWMQANRNRRVPARLHDRVASAAREVEVLRDERERLRRGEPTEAEQRDVSRETSPDANDAARAQAVSEVVPPEMVSDPSRWSGGRDRYEAAIDARKQEILAAPAGEQLSIEDAPTARRPVSDEALHAPVDPFTHARRTRDSTADPVLRAIANAYVQRIEGTLDQSNKALSDLEKLLRGHLGGDLTTGGMRAVHLTRTEMKLLDEGRIDALHAAINKRLTGNYRRNVAAGRVLPRGRQATPPSETPPPLPPAQQPDIEFSTVKGRREAHEPRTGWRARVQRHHGNQHATDQDSAQVQLRPPTGKPFSYSHPRLDYFGFPSFEDDELLLRHAIWQAQNPLPEGITNRNPAEYWPAVQSRLEEFFGYPAPKPYEPPPAARTVEEQAQAAAEADGEAFGGEPPTPDLAAAGVEPPPPPPPPAPSAPRPFDGGAGDGRGTYAAHPDDPSRQMPFRFRVVPLESLVTSHTDGATENPSYPRELQPRERERAMSRLQIEEIARKMNPDWMLDDTRRTDSGAPIVGADGLVESGNGRVLALRASRELAPERWAAYQAALRERLHAGVLGMDPAVVEGIADPVLIREPDFVRTPEERIDFVHQANKPSGMKLSATEQARSDARNLPPELLAGVTPLPSESLEGALSSPRNLPLVRKWLDTLSSNERNDLLEADGSRLTELGLVRLRNALFAGAFDGPAGERLQRLFLESADPVVKAVERGLFDGLPALVRAEGQARSGARDPSFSLSGDLGAAAEMLARLRKAGISVQEFLGQSGFFERELTPEQEQILAYLDAISKSGKSVRTFVERYARLVDEQPHTGQEGMFEGVDPLTRDQLLHLATDGVLKSEAEVPVESTAATEPLPSAARPRRVPSLEGDVAPIFERAEGEDAALAEAARRAAIKELWPDREKPPSGYKRTTKFKLAQQAHYDRLFNEREGAPIRGAEAASAAVADASERAPLAPDRVLGRPRLPEDVQPVRWHVSLVVEGDRARLATADDLQLGQHRFPSDFIGPRPAPPDVRPAILGRDVMDRLRADGDVAVTDAWPPRTLPRRGLPEAQSPQAPERTVWVQRTQLDPDNPTRLRMAPANSPDAVPIAIGEDDFRRLVRGELNAEDLGDPNAIPGEAVPKAGTPPPPTPPAKPPELGGAELPDDGSGPHRVTMTADEAAEADRKLDALFTDEGFAIDKGPVWLRARTLMTDRNAVIDWLTSRLIGRGSDWIRNPREAQRALTDMAQVRPGPRQETMILAQLFNGNEGKADALLARFKRDALRPHREYLAQIKLAMWGERLLEVAARFGDRAVMDELRAIMSAQSDPRAMDPLLARLDELYRQHAHEAGDYNLPVNLTPKEILYGIQQARDLVGPEAWAAHVMPAVEQWRNLFKHLVDEAVKYEMLDPEDVAAMREQNVYYAPLRRAEQLSDLALEGGTEQEGGVHFSNRESGIHALNPKGSEYQVLDPLIQTEYLVRNWLNRIDRNRVARSVHRDLLDTEQNRQFMFDGRQKNVAPPPRDWGKFAYLDKGEVVEIHVPKWVAEPMVQMRPQQASFLMQLFRYSATPLRLGAVAMNWAFAAKNLVIRDPMGASINWGAGVGPSLVEGFRVALNSRLPEWAQNPALQERYLEYLASGAGQSGMFEHMSHRRTVLEDVDWAGAKPRAKVQIAAKKAFNFMTAPSEISELTTKLATFEWAKKQGLTESQSAWVSRNSTFDAQKAGTAMRQFNLAVPFVNSRLQGTIQTLVRLRDDPAARLRFLLYGVAPAVAILAYNLRDEESRKKYLDIPDFDRRGNHVWVIGDHMNADGTTAPTYVAIPRDPAQQIAYTLVESALLPFVDENPEPWYTVAQRIADEFSPVQTVNPLSAAAVSLPPPIRAAVQHVSNYDFFRQRPVVPESQQGLPPAEQYGDYTSETAKTYGRLTGHSPRMVESDLETTTGGLSRQFLGALDFLGRAASGGRLVPEGHGEGQDLPLVGVYLHSQGGRTDEQRKRVFDATQRAALGSALDTLHRTPQYQAAPRDTQRALTRSVTTRTGELLRQSTPDDTLPSWMVDAPRQPGEPARYPLNWFPADVRAAYAGKSEAALDHAVGQAAARLRRWRADRRDIPPPSRMDRVLAARANRRNSRWEAWRRRTGRPQEAQRQALAERVALGAVASARR